MDLDLCNKMYRFQSQDFDSNRQYIGYNLWEFTGLINNAISSANPNSNELRQLDSLVERIIDRFVPNNFKGQIMQKPRKELAMHMVNSMIIQAYCEARGGEYLLMKEGLTSMYMAANLLGKSEYELAKEPGCLARLASPLFHVMVNMLSADEKQSAISAYRFSRDKNLRQRALTVYQKEIPDVLKGFSTYLWNNGIRLQFLYE